MEKSRIKINSSQSGQSVVELSFAIAIFIVGVVAIGYLLLDSQISIRKHKETIAAQSFAREGISALFSIRDRRFDALQIGNHGVALEGIDWKLTSSSTKNEQFNRSATLTDVDLEIKEIEVAVDWDVTSARVGNTTLVGALTDWKQNAGDGGSLEIDISAVALTSSSTSIADIAFQNTGSDSIILTGAVLQWNGDANLHRVSIEGTDVFSVASTSAISSGQFVDFDDYTVSSLSGTHVIEAVDFTDAISGTDVVTTLILGDGTRNHILLTF